MAFLGKFRSKSAKQSLVGQEFETQVDQCNKYESSVINFHKTSKRFVDTMAEANKTRARLTEMITTLALFKEEPDSRIDHFKTVNHGISELSRVFVGTLKEVAEEPSRKFIKIFPGINEQIRHYTKSAQEFEKSKAKLEKLRKSSQDSSKHAKAEKAASLAEAKFNQAKEYVPEELPMFLGSRSELFDPILAALGQAQLRFYSGVADTLETVCSGDDVEVDDETYQRDIDEIFADIAGLSITGEAEK